MKKSILTLGLFVLAVAAQAATVVTGSVYDASWTPEGSPYQIQGSAVIPSGATVKVASGVQVQLEPGASLEVQGTLKVRGGAAYPAQFNFGSGAYLLVKGGRLDASDAKFVGGYLVADDATIDLTACDITGGSGPYLRGATRGVFHSNKIYGNSCGFTLDGDLVKAEFTFNSIVSNTFGMHLKRYASLSFEYNSVHDNIQAQVVNDLHTPAVLRNNFWGTDQEVAVAKRGESRLEPLLSMKDVLREYVRTQLPNLPKGKSALVAKRAKAEKAAAVSAAKKAEALRKADAAVEAKAAKKKALEEKKAAEKAALEAKIKEVAPVETPASATPAPVASPEVSAAPEAAAASFGEIETTQPASSTTPATTPEPAPVEATTPAPAVTDISAASAAPAVDLAAPVAGNTDIPGLVTPPDAAAPATAAPASTTAPAASTEPAPVVTPAPAETAPAVPAGADQFNAAQIPAPPATAVPAAGAPDLSGLDLPPLNDKPIQPPTDFDLPPLDPSGNVQLPTP